MPRVTQIPITVFFDDGAPPCCCGQSEPPGVCDCEDLPATLYAMIDHYMVGPPPLYLPVLQRDYFTFSETSSSDGCVCNPIGGKRNWHGEFPSNYFNQADCSTHINMHCLDDAFDSMQFRFGVDKIIGQNCDEHSALCDECFAEIDCPVDEIHIGPVTSCGEVYEMWIRSTPWGD